jgi:hypothetical protein
MGLNIVIWIFARKKSILYSGRRETLVRGDSGKNGVSKQGGGESLVLSSGQKLAY